MISHSDPKPWWHSIAPTTWRDALYRWRTSLISDPLWQDRFARLPVISRWARRDGEQIFDLMMGFIHSQILMTLVRLEVFDMLRTRPHTIGEIASQSKLEPDTAELLCRAAVAMDLFTQHGDRYGLSRKGAVILGGPGLRQLIAHHDILYRDMGDPVAFFQRKTETELSQFWPYVFETQAKSDGSAATQTQDYSELMRASLHMVATDTLEHAPRIAPKKWLDVGGGSGGFARRVAQHYPQTRVAVFDLPHTQSIEEPFVRFEGSFKSDPLPQNYDMISLIRILYDHTDDTVRNLLQKCYHALPDGGQILISEPMLGAKSPTRPGDVYFATYTFAMQTGKTRSPHQVTDILHEIGYNNIRTLPSKRPFITSVIRAEKNKLR